MQKFKLLLAPVFMVLLLLLSSCGDLQHKSSSSSVNADQMHQQNLRSLKSVKPELVAQYFEKLTQIPHCSGEEAAIAQYIFDEARQLGLSAVKDAFNNVVVTIPATPGYESLLGVVFQSHIDMVCSPGKEIFPLQLWAHSDTLRAGRTTLGADNGVGVAMQLALMADKTIQHPLLKLVFTTGEETSMAGADGLDYSQFVGIGSWVNIDTEDWGSVTIGSAGGKKVCVFIPIVHSINANGQGEYLSVTVTGLTGGHSGVEAKYNRANAICELALLINDLLQYGVELVNMSGGTAANAIPSTAKAVIFVPKDKSEYVSNAIEHYAATMKQRFPLEHPRIETIGSTSNGLVMSTVSVTPLLRILKQIPNGVQKYEKDGKTPQTSNNIGMIAMNATSDTISVTMLIRSSRKSDLDEYAKKVADVCGHSAASKVVASFDPWQPDYSSPLLSRMQMLYKGQYGGDLKLDVIHAGTECGTEDTQLRIIFGDKAPNVISFSPCTIGRGHTPDEYLLISTIEKGYNFLVQFLKQKNAG